MKIVAQFGFDYSVQCILHGGSLYQYDFTADWKLPPLLPQLSSISSRSSRSSVSSISDAASLAYPWYHLYTSISSISILSMINYDVLAPFVFFCCPFFIPSNMISLESVLIGSAETHGRSWAVRGHRDAHHFQTVQHAAAPKYNTIMDLSRYRSHCRSVTHRATAENWGVQLGYSSVKRSPDALMDSKEYSWRWNRWTQLATWSQRLAKKVLHSIYIDINGYKWYQMMINAIFPNYVNIQRNNEKYGNRESEQKCTESSSFFIILHSSLSGNF